MTKIIGFNEKSPASLEPFAPPKLVFHAVDYAVLVILPVLVGLYLTYHLRSFVALIPFLFALVLLLLAFLFNQMNAKASQAYDKKQAEWEENYYNTYIGKLRKFAAKRYNVELTEEEAVTLVAGEVVVLQDFVVINPTTGQVQQILTPVKLVYLNKKSDGRIIEVTTGMELNAGSHSSEAKVEASSPEEEVTAEDETQVTD